MTGPEDQRPLEALSPIERLFAELPPEVHDQAMTEFLSAYSAHERANVLPFAWESLWARPDQREPSGDWDLWMIRAGRGYGKTRIGAETTRKRVRSGRAGHVTIIGTTAADARDVMIEGPLSGLLAVHPPEFRPLYEPSKRLLTWPNGAVGHVRSAEDPDSIRGLQSDWVWGDEPACLTGDSMVLTEHGWQRIDSITAGQRVHTRLGLRRVMWAGPTRPDARLVAVHTTCGVLRCTPDHLIATDTGWVRADAVTPGVRLASWRNTSLSARLPGSNGAAPAGIAIGTAITKIEQGCCSTGTCTPDCGRSMTTTMCTTSTGTKPTTNRRTSPESNTVNTPDCTASPLITPSGSDNENQASPLNEHEPCGRTATRHSGCATTAETVTHRSGNEHGSVHRPARHAPIVLAVESLSTREQTYDLSVEVDHEFIADGIVVHNSWRHPEAWDMAMLGNRLGNPAAILTGTPRPLQWLRDLEARPTTKVTTGSTYDNLANLAPAFIRLIIERYEGTRLGRQELRAQYLDDVEGALWRMATIEATRFPRWSVTDPWKALIELVTPASRLALGLGPWAPDKHERRRWETWVSVDPPAETAECGIVVGMAPERARYGYDHAVILDDMSLAGPPEDWGPQVVEAFRKHDAKGVIVEANQGGDMVRSTVHAVDPSVPVEKIRAKESKSDRAEPVSALYARGWVHHVGHFAALETQQTTWVADESPSPDRLDALVHLVTKLLKPPTSGGGKARVLSPGLPAR